MPENVEWPKFKPNEKAGGLLLEWWRELAVNRGDRADLKRVSKPVEVMFNPAYHRFRIRLLSSGFNIHNERLAVVVGLSARIKNNDPSKPVARQMGESKSAGRPSVAELRFRRILETDQPEEFFPILSRTLPLLGNTLNLLDLADSVYGWNDYQRKRWALEYYSMLPEKAAKS